MSTLKELKSRISSVKSTKKITKVMKMVAAAKLKKAQKKAFDSRPCAIEFKKLINKIISTIPENELPPLIMGSKDTGVHLLFVIASGKGLCGGYNSHIIKLTKKHLAELLAKRITPKIVCIGNKAKSLLNNDFGKYIIKSVEKIDVSYEDAHILTRDIITENSFDSAEIFYTKFESSISQIPLRELIIPFEKENIPPYECIYEPNKKLILDTLALRNVTIQLYKAMAESIASELFARMMAMDNATTNADDMIKKLTLHYNRSRQAAITKELIEVISGAEAINE